MDIESNILVILYKEIYINVILIPNKPKSLIKVKRFLVLVSYYNKLNFKENWLYTCQFADISHCVR